MKLVGWFLGEKNMPVITGDAIKYNCIKPYVPSVPEKGHKETEQIQIRRRVLQNAASDQELQFAYWKLYSKQNQNGIRQSLNDKWSRPIDKDGIFLGQYGLIVSLSVQNGFKTAFLVVLSLPR